MRRRMKTTSSKMARCWPVSLSVLVVALLVLFLMSWSSIFILYEIRTGSSLSSTHILSKTQIPSGPQDAMIHPRAIIIHRHNTTIDMDAPNTPSKTKTHQANATNILSRSRENQTRATNNPSKTKQDQTKLTNTQSSTREEQTKATNKASKPRKNKIKATNNQSKARNNKTKAISTPFKPRDQQMKVTNTRTHSTNTYVSSSSSSSSSNINNTVPNASDPLKSSNSTEPPSGSGGECGEQYQEEGPMRRVVLWTSFWHSWDGWKGMIRDHGALRQDRCPMWRCEFLWDPNVTITKVQEADAVIFFSLDVTSRPLPPRLPHALWIWLELESPVISKKARKNWAKLEASGVFFNFTMSYHHLNPITAIAGELVPLSTPEHCPISSSFYLDTSSPTYTSYSSHMHQFDSWMSENEVVLDERLRAERNKRHGGLIYWPKDNTTLPKPLQDDDTQDRVRDNENTFMEEGNLTLTPEEITLATRPRVAVWMASHCPTDSRREELIAALQNFITVTTVGKCGQFKCGNNHMDDYCYRWLAASHLFYLSFENALCDDYVTEKLWTPMKHGMVPVVYGGANYRHILPFDSYIDVSKFSNATSLAKHLLYLATHPVAYLRHLQWRRYWKVRRLVPWCDLCATVHRQTHPVRATMKQWWSNTTTCHKPSSWR